MKSITTLFSHDIVRYLFSGGVAAATNLGLLFVFTHFFGLHYLISGILAFCCAVVVSFIMQKKWAFSDHSTDATHKKFIIFLIVALINLGLNTLLLYFFTDICGVRYLVSQILASGIVAVWSYFIYKKVFKTT